MRTMREIFEEKERKGPVRWAVAGSESGVGRDEDVVVARDALEAIKKVDPLFILGSDDFYFFSELHAKRKVKRVDPSHAEDRLRDALTKSYSSDPRWDPDAGSVVVFRAAKAEQDYWVYPVAEK